MSSHPQLWEGENSALLKSNKAAYKEQHVNSKDGHSTQYAYFDTEGWLLLAFPNQ